jgi:3-hydroxyisobutyrate dehydrogenase-like beta-hydroxyacid dehydrogenase
MAKHTGGISDSMRIGIAGVGLMGLGIATNIARAGYMLSYLEHQGNQATDGLEQLGGSGVASGRLLAEQCDVVILCVTGAREVEDILTREDGILAGLRENTLIIDCSTSMPDVSRRLASMVHGRTGRFMDAPMTRTPKEAMEGRLNLIVGADIADFEEALPLLECFADNITRVGGIGEGHAMKLLHNFVSLGFTAVLAEAAASAAKAGIDPQTFVDVLSRGGGGSVVLERLKPFILDEDPSGLMFSIANAHKDVGYYCEMAEGLEVEKTTAEGVLGLFANQVEAGRGAQMLPYLARLLQLKI